MKKKRSDIMAAEGDRRREACFEAVSQIKAALREVERLQCNLDSKTVSILQLSAAVLSEISERQ